MVASSVGNIKVNVNVMQKTRIRRGANIFNAPWFFSMDFYQNIAWWDDKISLEYLLVTYGYG